MNYSTKVWKLEINKAFSFLQCVREAETNKKEPWSTFDCIIDLNISSSEKE